jgi:hypothetical protein
MRIISVLYTATLLATAVLTGTPAEASIRVGSSDTYAISGAYNANAFAANATDNSFDDIVLGDTDMSTIIDAAKSGLVKNRRHLRSHR